MQISCFGKVGVMLVIAVIAIACTVGVTAGDKMGVMDQDENAVEARNLVKKGKKSKGTRIKDDSIDQQGDVLTATIVFLEGKIDSQQEVINSQHNMIAFQEEELLDLRDQCTIDPDQEEPPSFLFVQIATNCELRLLDGGRITAVGNIGEETHVFSDRPQRLQYNMPTLDFVESFDSTFKDSLPNAAITAVSTDRDQFGGPAVAILSNASMMADGRVSYDIAQSVEQDAEFSLLPFFKKGSVVQFTDCSIFIDSVGPPGGHCEEWCESDRAEQGDRHCAPGNMAHMCGGCDYCGDTPTPNPPISPPTQTLKVMSYNTQYTGYRDGRIPSFAAKIAEVAADVVGVQECQIPDALAVQSGYTLLTDTGTQNYILYNANRLQQLDSGSMQIPRDDHAPRALTWGRFRILEGSGVGNEFWFFNTHLPHRANEASDPNTHARIGRMLLAKRIELGANNSPTIVVGDCNPFASAGASEGSFESNLGEGGIIKIYEATGRNGGYAGLDKIFASKEYWTGSGSDVGTGRSDHPAIAADLTLVTSLPPIPPPRPISIPPLQDNTCGCKECDEVWDVMAGSYTCGERINYLQSESSVIDGGPYEEAVACSKVASDQYPIECGNCDRSICNNNPVDPPPSHNNNNVIIVTQWNPHWENTVSFKPPKAQNVVDNLVNGNDFVNLVMFEDRDFVFRGSYRKITDGDYCTEQKPLASWDMLVYDSSKWTPVGNDVHGCLQDNNDRPFVVQKFSNNNDRTEVTVVGAHFPHPGGPDFYPGLAGNIGQVSDGRGNIIFMGDINDNGLTTQTLFNQLGLGALSVASDLYNTCCFNDGFSFRFDRIGANFGSNAYTTRYESLLFDPNPINSGNKGDYHKPVKLTFNY